MSQHKLMPSMTDTLVERLERVEREYWESFRQNRAPVIGPGDLRAILDAARKALEDKTLSNGGLS
jgi:hypothetical protein